MTGQHLQVIFSLLIARNVIESLPNAGNSCKILPPSCSCSDEVIYCANVTGVTKESLQQIPVYFPKLTTLHITGDTFAYLDDDTFDLHGANWNLKQLDLSNNSIIDINEHCFVHLPELEELKLTGNNISFRIRPYVPGRRVWSTGSFLSPVSANLRTLNLAGAFNREETAQPEHFEFNLATVNLFNPEDRFQAMEYLDLSNNGLLHLPPNLFQGMPTLQYLYLSKNMMKHFDLDPGNGERLVELHLQSNTIQRVNDSFMEMVEGRRYLKRVYLEGNPFICDCQSQSFVEWIAKSTKIADRDQLYCSMDVAGKTTNVSLNFAATRLKCADEGAPNSNTTVFVLCSLAAIVLAGLLLGLLYANRRLLCKNTIDIRKCLTMTNIGGYEMLEEETRTMEAVPL